MDCYSSLIKTKYKYIHKWKIALLFSFKGEYKNYNLYSKQILYLNLHKHVYVI